MIEDIWNVLKSEAESVSHAEPLLSSVLDEFVLQRESFLDALSWRVASRIAKGTIPEDELRLFKNCFRQMIKFLFPRPKIWLRSKNRILPAMTTLVLPSFKGFQALCAYRACHQLWNSERYDWHFIFRA